MRNRTSTHIPLSGGDGLGSPFTAGTLVTPVVAHTVPSGETHLIYLLFTNQLASQIEVLGYVGATDFALDFVLPGEEMRKIGPYVLRGPANIRVAVAANNLSIFITGSAEIQSYQP